MKSFVQKLISVLSLVVSLFSSVAFSQSNATVNPTTSGQPEIYFVPDVADQFNKLALRPDALAFGLSPTAPQPRIGKHFQGIARRHGPGTPYMFLSRSGNDVPECPFCNDDPGNIFIVRMASRDTNGERMRSNRLVSDWAIVETFPGPRGAPNPWPTPPYPEDKNFKTIHFNGQDGWPNYAHPGGLQMMGDVLVVPLSRPYNDGDPKLLIQFIDVSNPEAPDPRSQFNPLSVSPPSSEFGAGEVAISPVKNPMGPGVRYIMLLAGENNKDIRLYRSLPTCSDGSTDLKDENVSWESIGRWSNANVGDTSANTWPTDGSQSYQMFNFIRQESLNGPLFMIATYNESPVLHPFGGTDFMDLYRVNVDQYGSPEDTLLTRDRHKHVGTESIGGGGDTSHFSGSTGTYVSPSGELIVYASEHAAYGPPELLPNGEKGRDTVRFGEYRHREMVRPDSPTLRPSVEAMGPFVVDEGSTLMLSAHGKAPITKAWIQLFEDDGMGLSLPGFFDDDRWLAIDYQDSTKDDYDNFPKLLWYFNDNAGSWRWFAPIGCTLHVNQHSIDDADFPGRRKTLVGTGFVEEATDLDNVKDDNDEGSMDDMISSVKFLCDAYYNATIGVFWDFDRNGTFEISGDKPTFSAGELDGPYTYSVPVRAQHPTDTSSLGQSAPATVDIIIRNVPPRIGSLNLVDPLGFKVGIDVPFAIVNLPYVVEGSFTDPGKPDTQTARLDMGDGTTVESTAFDQFSDAFGGATGQARERHKYRASGTYTIAFEVKDDDNGMTTATKTIIVVTPAELVRMVIDKIDQLLATTTNSAVARALRDARDSLAGHNNGSAHDGALDALASGEFVAALEKIGAAIEALQRAETAGAGDLSELKNLLGLAGESVAQGAYQDAIEAVGTPNPGQALQLETIRQLIIDGHTRLVNSQYLAAIDLFKDAVGRARSLP